MSDPDKKLKLKEWCVLQAVIEGNAPLLAFRGKPVVYPVASGDVGLAVGDDALTASLDGRWNVAVTIAGPIPSDDQFHINRQLRLATGGFTYNSNAEVAGLMARARKVSKEKQAGAAAAEAKVIGKKRPQVVFSASSFTYGPGEEPRWELPPLLAAGDSAACDHLSYKAYAKEPKGDNGYELAFMVDGEQCASSALRTTATHLVATSGSGECEQPLKAPGEHKIVISLHEVVATKLGGKEIVSKGAGGAVVKDRYAGRRGKKLGEWNVQCATKGGNAAQRFE